MGPRARPAGIALRRASRPPAAAARARRAAVEHPAPRAEPGRSRRMAAARRIRAAAPGATAAAPGRPRPSRRRTRQPRHRPRAAHPGAAGGRLRTHRAPAARAPDRQRPRRPRLVRRPHLLQVLRLPGPHAGPARSAVPAHRRRARHSHPRSPRGPAPAPGERSPALCRFPAARRWPHSQVRAEAPARPPTTTAAAPALARAGMAPAARRSSGRSGRSSRSSRTRSRSSWPRSPRSG